MTPTPGLGSQGVKVCTVPAIVVESDMEVFDVPDSRGLDIEPHAAILAWCTATR